METLTAFQVEHCRQLLQVPTVKPFTATKSQLTSDFCHSLLTFSQCQAYRSALHLVRLFCLTSAQRAQAQVHASMLRIPSQQHYCLHASQGASHQACPVSSQNASRVRGASRQTALYYQSLLPFRSVQRCSRPCGCRSKLGQLHSGFQLDTYLENS